jgi:hypothetical protein
VATVPALLLLFGACSSPRDTPLVPVSGPSPDASVPSDAVQASVAVDSGGSGPDTATGGGGAVDAPVMDAQPVADAPIAPPVQDGPVTAPDTAGPADAATACLTCADSPGVCIRTSYDFESGTNEGWSPGTVSTARAHGGTHSLAMTVTLPETGGSVSATLKLCSGTADLKSRTLREWIYIEGDPFKPEVDGMGSFCNFRYIETGTSYVYPGNDVKIQPNTWFEVATGLGLTTTATPTVDMRCWIQPAANSPWKGTVYFDDLGLGLE